MTTQMDQRNLRTMNLRIDLWQRLFSIKIKHPKFESLNDVIEAILNQNKKLKNEVAKLKGGIDEGDKSEDKD